MSEPIKVKEAQIAIFGLKESELKNQKDIGLKFTPNEAKFNDNYLQNPFDSDSDYRIFNFLTSSEPTFYDTKITNVASTNTVLTIKMEVEGQKFFSSRRIYSILDFLSEIGGFSGIFIPIASAILKILQTQKLYTISLIKHMQPLLRKSVQSE